MKLLFSTPAFQRLSLLLLPFLVTGCPWVDQEDEDNPIIEEIPEEAVEKCINMMEWACTEGAYCFTGLSSWECIERMKVEADCENATAVRYSYYDCRTEIYDWDCAQNRIPEQCAETISTASWGCIDSSIPTSCRTAIVFDNGSTSSQDTASSSGSDTDSDTTAATEDSETAELPSGDPVAMCEAIVTATCNHSKGCLEAAGVDDSTTATVWTQCMTDTYSAFKCDSVTAVNSNFEACIAAINAVDCSAGETEVTECTDVLSY